MSDNNNKTDRNTRVFDNKTGDSIDELLSTLPTELPPETPEANDNNVNLNIDNIDDLLATLPSDDKDEPKSNPKKENSENETEKPEMSSKKNPKQKPKKRYRFNFKRLLLSIMVLILLGVGVVGGWVIFILAGTPKVDPTNIYDLLPENSVLYDSSGNELQKVFDGRSGEGLRTNVEYKEMPKHLVDAFIAIEDKTFWEHHGFNFVRIVGAVYDSLQSGENIKGTSTLTQQLARNIYLEDKKSHRTLTRKIQEAYYALVIERKLSKEQIIEAYLNTISLGNGAYGVQAAAKAYFGKDVSKLTLGESAVLASLAKAPSSYSPMRRLNNDDIDNPGERYYIYKGDTYSLIYSDRYRERQLYTLKMMLEQGLISKSQHDAAVNEDIRAALKPDISKTSDITTYYADYTIKRVIEDLMEKKNIDEAQARRMVYHGGLRIHGTLDINMQRKVENEFKNNSNFPRVVSVRKDKSGNAVDKYRNIMLYKYSNIFDGNGSFVIKPNEYKQNDDGSVTLLKGHRLNFYKTKLGGDIDYSVEVKAMYIIEDGTFYTIDGAFLNIPKEVKILDKEGNLILTPAFFRDRPNHKPTENGIVFATGSYQLKSKVVQPQAAMVIIDYHNGAVKTMVGGRKLLGEMLYNRALSPRQPGSSIKPIGVYGPALQRTADMVATGTLGKYKVWAAASGIEDAPMRVGRRTWPKNWYSGYRGWMSLRKSVEQSVNVNAVKVWNDIGPETSIKFLKSVGVTSIVEDKEGVNDLNPAALALGGMTRGISPMEMAAAYGAFGNCGTYIKPIPYSKVTNKKGEVILDGSSEKRQAMDPGVAFIMTDILRTTVSNGIAKRASIGSQPVAGKTGTTSDNYDAWFVGLTPYYSASLWIGNDINLELSQGSMAAAGLWSKIMRQVHSGMKRGSFAPKPANVVTSKGDYTIKGAVPKDTAQTNKMVTVCKETGLLATENCPFTVSKPIEDAPKEMCNVHTTPTDRVIETPDPPVQEEPPVDSNPPVTPPSNDNHGGGGSSDGGGGGGNTPPAPEPPINNDPHGGGGIPQPKDPNEPNLPDTPAGT